MRNFIPLFFALVNAFSLSATTIAPDTSKINEHGVVPSQSRMTLALPPPICGLSSFSNYVSTTKYGLSGSLTPLSSGLISTDNFGRAEFIQWMNYSKNVVLASKTIYDRFGRSTLTTLPAPLANNVFCNDANFILESVSQSSYSYTDFDLPTQINAIGELFNPSQVSVTSTLGAYYGHSSSNLNIASSSYPFLRSIYSNNVLPEPIGTLGYNQVKSTNPERIARKFNMVSGSELDYVFGIEQSYLTDGAGLSIPMRDQRFFKNVIFTPNNGVAVSYENADGQTVASCQSEIGGSCIPQVSSLDLEEGARIDIHIPTNHFDDVKIRFPDPIGKHINGGITYCIDCYQIKLYDVVNQIELIEDVDFELLQTSADKRLYDVSFITLDNSKSHLIGVTANLTSIGEQEFWEVLTHVKRLTFNPEVIFTLDYNNWQLYYYDESGNNTRIVQPESVNCQYDAALFHDDKEDIIFNKYGSSTVEIYRFPIETAQINSNILKLNWWPSGVYKWGVYDFADANMEVLCAPSQLPESASAIDVFLETDLDVHMTSSGDVSVYGQFVDPNNEPISNSINVTPPTDNYKIETWMIKYKYDIIVYGVDANGIEQQLSSKPARFEREYTKYEMFDGNAKTYFFDEKFYHYLDNVLLDWQNSFKRDDFYFDDISANLHDYSEIIIKIGNVSKTSNTPKIACYDVSGGVSTVCSNFTPETDVWETNLCRYSIWGQIGYDFISKPTQIAHNSLQEYYTYDDLGNLLSQTDPDQGLSTYIYSTRNQARFSQNAIQSISNRFTYVNYDNAGRVIEAGVYDNAAADATGDDLQYTATAPLGSASGNIHSYIDLEFDLPPTYKIDIINYSYDLPTNDLPVSLSTVFTQQYVRGRLAKSWNAATKTWYSYTYMGALDWVITWNNQTGYSTVRYHYDSDHQLSQISHNELSSDQDFYIKYTYTTDRHLEKVYTSEFPDRQFKLQSTLVYDDLGRVIRKQLGSQYQGVDYAYTLEGSLKTINNAMAGAANDPGQDGLAAGSNPNSFDDLFAETLSYYDGDYVKNGTNIQTIAAASDQYTGKVKASTWFTPTELGSVYNTDIKNYNYTYDSKGQLVQATFGTLTTGTLNGNSGGGSSPVFTDALDFSTAYSYDLNGNMNDLERYAYGGSGSSIDDLQYNYPKSNGQLTSNKLQYISDANLSTSYNGELTNQLEGNYSYDQRGRLIGDATRDIFIEYDDYDRIKAIYYFEQTSPRQQFYYDDSGKLYKTTYLDNEGQIERVNFRNYYAGGVNYAEINWLLESEEVISQSIKYYVYDVGRTSTAILDPLAEVEYQYELKDHIGNVRVSFSNEATLKGSSAFTTSLDDWTLRSNTTHSINLQNGLTINSDNKGGVYKTFTVTAGKRLTCGVELTSLVGLGVRMVVLESGTNVGLGHIDLESGYNELSVQNPNASQVIVQIWIHNSQVGPGSSFTIRDFKLEQDELEVLRYADFYPFGWEMPGRVYTSSAHVNDFGYQGEYARSNDEFNWSEFEVRNYDGRVGRFLNPDPARQFHSLYLAMGNDPVNRVDPDGAWSYYSDACGCDWDTEWGLHPSEYAHVSAHLRRQMENSIRDRSVIVAPDYTDLWNSRSGYWMRVMGNLGGIEYTIETKDGPVEVYGDVDVIDEWVPFKTYDDGLTFLEGLHIGLDIAGLYPGFGEPFDVINAAIYLAEGDYENASYSVAAMVPVAGWAAIAAKYALKALKARKAAKAVVQVFDSFDAFKKVFGAAGENRHWHHIVEQHADNVAKFGENSIHNTENLINIPGGFEGALHGKVTGHYNSKMRGTSMRVRDHVKTLSYEKQYQYGIDTLRRFGWTP